MANPSEPRKILGGTSPRKWPKQGDPLTDTEKQTVATGLLLFKAFMARGPFDRDLVIQMLTIVTKLGIRAEWDEAVKIRPSGVITER